MNLGCLVLTVIKQIWRYIYAFIYKDTCLRVPRGNRDGLKCTKSLIYRALKILSFMAWENKAKIIRVNGQFSTR